MKKKLLAVLMTGVMAASFAGTATVVSADSGDDNTLTVWAWDQNFNIKSMQMAGEQYAKDHEAIRTVTKNSAIGGKKFLKPSDGKGSRTTGGRETGKGMADAQTRISGLKELQAYASQACFHISSK